MILTDYICNCHFLPRGHSEIPGLGLQHGRFWGYCSSHSVWVLPLTKSLHSSYTWRMGKWALGESVYLPKWTKSVQVVFFFFPPVVYICLKLITLAALGLGCSTASCGVFPCGARTLYSWLMGSVVAGIVALRHVVLGSPTRDWTCIPCTARWIFTTGPPG